MQEQRQGSSLKEFLKEHKGNFEFCSKVTMLLEMARSINYLHSLRSSVLLGNICLDSFLVSESFKISLVNFDSAKELNIQDETKSEMETLSTEEYLSPSAKSFIPRLESDTIDFGLLMIEIFLEEEFILPK